MANIIEFANEIKDYLLSVKEISHCTVCGSIANQNYDKYSDIDIEIDVSGYNNSEFIKQVPAILSKKYPLIFGDYAPSLMPESYIVSVAINEENPFMFVDIKCLATPHMSTLQKKDFVNDEFEHILKLWVINFKHWLRNDDCRKDIVKMGSKVLGNSCLEYREKQILEETLRWLEFNMKEKHLKYVSVCREYMDNLNK